MIEHWIDKEEENIVSEVLGGYLVVQTMKRLGVDTIFGMPGFQLMSVYDGLCQIDGCPRHMFDSR